MFSIFKKKDTIETPPIVADQDAPRFLIITATTNFGLVVVPETKEPLMFKMEPTDTIATCVERNVPAVAAATDVSTCLVVQFAATLPNQVHAVNKFFALILPDPGILINENFVLVGYEEIDKIPGPTSSVLKALVKQMPQEYFAEPKVEPGHVNKPLDPAPSAPVAAAPTEPTSVSSPDSVAFAPEPAPEPTVVAPSEVPVAPEPTQSQVTGPNQETPSQSV